MANISITKCPNQLSFDIFRGSYFAEHGNSVIFMAENGNTAYILLDFGQKNNDGNGNIILEGRETEIINMIVMDVENHRS